MIFMLSFIFIGLWFFNLVFHWILEPFNLQVTSRDHLVQLQYCNSPLGLFFEEFLHGNVPRLFKTKHRGKFIFLAMALVHALCSFKQTSLTVFPGFLAGLMFLLFFFNFKLVLQKLRLAWLKSFHLTCQSLSVSVFFAWTQYIFTFNYFLYSHTKRK